MNFEVTFDRGGATVFLNGEQRARYRMPSRTPEQVVAVFLHYHRGYFVDDRLVVLVNGVRRSFTRPGPRNQLRAYRSLGGFEP